MSVFFSVSGVKILGRSIGSVGKPSEVDGDGDGFRTGPDGEDNIPAPKAVVDAARKVGRVADILKPTDDLFEVRKSGRPWRPLLFDHLPDDFKDDFRKLYDDVARHMHAKGKKWAELEPELVKKYGGSEDDRIINRWGSWTDWAKKNIPSDELKQYGDLMNNYLLGEWGDNKFEDNRAMNKRIDDLEKRYFELLDNAFNEQRKKAIAEGKGEQFDRFFKKFGESYREEGRGFVARMIRNEGANSVVARAWAMGKEGREWEDQFKKAEKEARELVNNPKKRIVTYIDADLLGQILDDGRMKNFFEAKRNVFNDEFVEMEAYDRWGAKERRQRYLRGRLEGEQAINGIPKYGAQGKHRPIYAMLFPDGFHAIRDSDDEDWQLAYGDVALVMRHSVEERATFTAADGLNMRFAGASPVNAPSAISMIPQRLLAYDANERRAAMRGAVDPRFTEGKVFDYTEAQIVGGVNVSDIAYVGIRDEVNLPDQIKQRLKEMGIPVVVHNSSDIYEEPEELAQKQEDSAGGYVLFATWGNRKLFVPSTPPKKQDDMHGMISRGTGKRQRVENVSSVMKFGNWELV